MSDRVYKKVEIVGTSTTGIEDAVQNAVATASQSIRNIDWFEVCEMRGHVSDGSVAHYQVVIKVGFRLER